MRNYAKFYITPKGERAARNGHPWVSAKKLPKLKAVITMVI